MTRTLFLDTETTGLYPGDGDRLIEVCLLEYRSRQPTGRLFHTYLDPGDQEIHQDAIRVHGIVDQDLLGRPSFADVAAELLAFCRGSQVVAHNAPFDVAFLDAELERADLSERMRFVCKIIDSLELARQKWPGKRNNLNAVCQRLKIDTSGREVHGALVDCELLAEAYLEMTRGQYKIELTERDLGIVRWQRPKGCRLPVPQPSAEELAAHRAMMKRIHEDKQA